MPNGIGRGMGVMDAWVIFMVMSFRGFDVFADQKKDGPP